MRKNKLYILLTLIITVILFGTAATCTQCGANIDKALGDLGGSVDEESPGTEPGGVQPSGTEPGETPSGDEPEPEPEPEEEAEEPEPEPELEPESEEAADEPEPEPEPEETSIAASEEISGFVKETGSVSLRSFVNVGDSTGGNQTKGYLSFDISGLHGKTVQDAEINFISIQSYGNPDDFATALVVEVYNYVRLDESDFRGYGVHLASIPITDTSYTIRGETLETELQRVLNNEIRDYFQIRLSLDAATNGDGISDGITICCNEAVLYISYSD